MSLPEPVSSDRTDLCERLGYTFGDPKLLELALTHRSWCAEFPAAESNERLEFLGDAVLGLAVTDELYGSFPDQSEGELAKVRAAVVSSPSLAEVARTVNVGPHLLLGRGEDSSGGRDKSSILADAMEALIGAVYLDGGWTASHELVLRLLGEQIVDVTKAGPGSSDYKTRLQELVAHLGFLPPEYAVQGSGPDHDKRFQARVTVNSIVQGTGEGTSKKQAEQFAAEQAWAALSPDSHDDHATISPTSPAPQSSPTNHNQNEPMTERPEIPSLTADERAQADV